LSPAPPAGGANVWPVTVRRRIFVGDVVEYLLDWNGVSLRARELSTRLFDDGQVVFCEVDPLHAVLLP
jgi:iron(III) transport system ATP-binding protein